MLQCPSFWCGLECLLHTIWAWHPPVGVWIGILGLLGVVVALVRDPEKISRQEKAAWILVMFLLLLLEVKTVYQDRDEHDEAERQSRERSEQNFREIAQGIQGAIDRLNTTITEGRRHFDTTIEGLNRIVNTETGGNSFCYLELTPALHDVGGMEIVKVGKYPLRGVSAELWDSSKSEGAVRRVIGSDPNHNPDPEAVFRAMDSARTSIAVPDFATPTRFLGGYQMTNESKQSFSLFFRAFNGTWIERLEMRRVADDTSANGATYPSKWAAAIEVEGAPVGRAKFFKIDKNYPRVNGQLDVNWPRPAKGRPPWEH